MYFFHRKESVGATSEKNRSYVYYSEIYAEATENVVKGYTNNKDTFI